MYVPASTQPEPPPPTKPSVIHLIKTTEELNQGLVAPSPTTHTLIQRNRYHSQVQGLEVQEIPLCIPNPRTAKVFCPS